MITPRSSLLKHEIINMLFGVLGYHTLDRVERGSYYCNIRITKVATGQSMSSHFAPNLSLLCMTKYYCYNNKYWS